VKTFVLDTNVLLHDPGSLYNFEENDIIIPIVVFEELDKFKKELGDIGRNARDVMRSIDALRSRGSLRDGVSLGEGKGILLIVSGDIKCDFAGLGTSADNYILGITQKLLKNGCSHITLVTKDINLRLKADAFGIPAEDYLSDKVAEQQLSLVREIEAEADVIDAIYSLGSLNAETSGIDADFSENNCYVLKGSSKKSALVRCVKGSLKIDSQRQVSGIKPRSAEQKFLVDMLMDPAIDMVVCAGVAGSGKTLLSIACGLEMTVQGAYDKVLITKAIHPAGADIGYVKGDKREKMR